MPEPQKTFSQNDVNGLIAAEKAKHRAALERVSTELEQWKTVAEASKGRVAELEQAAEALTKERDDARAEAATHADSVSTLQREHEAGVAAHRRFRTELALTQALVSAKVLPQATKLAAAQLAAETQIEADESGNVKSVTYGGQRYTSAEQAAAAFLKANEFMASAPKLGGGGSKPPTMGHGIVVHRDLENEDPAALAELGWKEPVR